MFRDPLAAKSCQLAVWLLGRFGGARARAKEREREREAALLVLSCAYAAQCIRLISSWWARTRRRKKTGAKGEEEEGEGGEFEGALRGGSRGGRRRSFGRRKQSGLMELIQRRAAEQERAREIAQGREQRAESHWTRVHSPATMRVGQLGPRN